MKLIKIALILEIFLIVVIPIMTVGLDLVEDSHFYNIVFNFDKLSKSIYRFKSDYTLSEKHTIFKDTDENEFNNLWKLITSHTHVPLRKLEPYAISRLKINNPSTVSLPYHAPDVILIPESAPIVAVYYQFSKDQSTKIPGKDIIIVGTVADLERWFLDAKNSIRIKVNMLISLISIFIGLFIFIKEKASKQKKPG